jgi:biopolymer transport protein ExbD
VARSIIEENVHQGDGPMAAINVTSLVDVMFCLLIMFMIATPLMTPEGLEVDLPAGRGKVLTEADFLYSVISVDAKGNIFLGSLALSTDRAKMQEELANNTKLGDDGMVFIQGDQNVDYERIVDILVGLQKAEISSVGFVADPNANRLREPVQ